MTQHEGEDERFFRNPAVGWESRFWGKMEPQITTAANGGRHSMAFIPVPPNPKEGIGTR